MAARRPDLSSKAINRSVVARALQHPAVVYPAAAGAIGGLGVALLAAPPALAIGAAVAGVLAVVGFGANYLLRHERFAKEYVADASAAIQAERETALETLEQDLFKLGRKDAMRQLDRFREKMRAFEEMLSEKLGENELTHARFLGIAEQVYLSALDNLRGVVYAARSQATIDAAYIRHRIATLEGAKPVRAGEIEALKEQLRLHGEHIQRNESALAQNEQALARLDAALAAVSQMKTEAGRAPLDMETAMQELSRIAKRAREYA